MDDIIWEIKVPIFKNRLILKQLFYAIGIPFGILIVFMFIIQAYYGVLIILITLILTLILVLLIFKGTYDVHFELKNKGILCQNQVQQAKRVKKLSMLTFILGTLSRNPTAAGAGMLSGTNTKVFIPWTKIRKIKYLKKQKCIIIQGGFLENIAIFCENNNYETVVFYIYEKIKENT